MFRAKPNFITMSNSIIAKLVTVGDGGVGKTTLLRRFVEGQFSAETKMTIGVEFFLKEIEIDNQKCSLQLWDFGGQERFRFLLQNYAVGAKGALLMFDLTRPSTLNKLEEWINICRIANRNLPILFLGTKFDLANEISITKEYILKLKEDYNFFEYLETSAKTGKNIDLAFELITREILKKKRLIY